MVIFKFFYLILQAKMRKVQKILNLDPGRIKFFNVKNEFYTHKIGEKNDQRTLA